MKLNESQIELNTVKMVDRDVVEFTTKGGVNVVVGRRLDGWRVKVAIKVDGVIWHDVDADDETMAVFNRLKDLAWEIYEHETLHRRAQAKAAARAVFLADAERGKFYAPINQGAGAPGLDPAVTGRFNPTV